MADLDDKKLMNFVNLMVTRGLGLYGQELMAKICYESGIALTDQNEIDWLEDNHIQAVNKLLVNYGSRNLPAKMTAIVLARQNQIPVPEELLTKRSSKKRRSIFKRFRRK
ncbi:hypothetical protein [Candidatus Harpocratesius sp.]